MPEGIALRLTVAARLPKSGIEAPGDLDFDRPQAGQANRGGLNPDTRLRFTQHRNPICSKKAA